MPDAGIWLPWPSQVIAVISLTSLSRLQLENGQQQDSSHGKDHLEAKQLINLLQKVSVTGYHYVGGQMKD